MALYLFSLWFCMSQGYHEGVIEAEYIASSILGKPAEDDYLVVASEALKQYRNSPTPLEEHAMSPANYLDIEHAYRLVNNQSSNQGEATSQLLRLDNGYIPGPKGGWFITCKIDMGEVTGPMFDWWLRVCDDSEKYRWWHPEAHLSGEWDLPYHRLQLYERAMGYYVDHVHTVTQRLTDKERLMSYDYDRPSKVFGHVNVNNSDGATFVCARVHTNNNVVGWIGIGHMCYIIHTVGNRTEMRCW
jgi:hypothetical protein